MARDKPTRKSIASFLDYFCFFMETPKGRDEYVRRQRREPDIIQRLLKRAGDTNNADELLKIVYYGLLSSRMRHSIFNEENPYAPIWRSDTLSYVREKYSKAQIEQQALLLLELFRTAQTNPTSAIAMLSTFKIKGLDYNLNLGSLTPTLLALNPDLMIVNGRIRKTYEDMSSVVIGSQMKLPYSMDKYGEAIQHIDKFRQDFVASFNCPEAINDPHWFNLFCAIYCDSKHEILQKSYAATQTETTSQRKGRKGKDRRHNEASTTVKIESATIERHRNEAKLVNAFRKWLSVKKKVTSITEEQFVDVSFTHGGKSYTVEAKYGKKGHPTNSIRTAIGQLLDYNLYTEDNETDIWLVLLNKKPTEADRRWVHSMRQRFGEESFPVYLAWKKGKTFELDGCEI